MAARSRAIAMLVRSSIARCPYRGSSPRSSCSSSKSIRPSPRLSPRFNVPIRRGYASSPTADELMENLTDLYGTARDEFEIAAEETTKKTVYAADDREAAKEALQALKDAFAQAVKESSPEVGKEIQARVGQRIRELEGAMIGLEESAMED